MCQKDRLQRNKVILGDFSFFFWLVLVLSYQLGRKSNDAVTRQQVVNTLTKYLLYNVSSHLTFHFSSILDP